MGAGPETWIAAAGTGAMAGRAARRLSIVQPTFILPEKTRLEYWLAAAAGMAGMATERMLPAVAAMAARGERAARFRSMV